VFGNDITHLGAWDYSNLNLGGFLNATNYTSPLDVFGVTSASGHDLHFSYLGNDSDKLSFKFGFGPGPTTTSRIKVEKAAFQQKGKDLIEV